MGKLVESKGLLVPFIFTEQQFGIIIKKMRGKALTKNEQVYFSASITKKLKAIYQLAGIGGELKVYGRERMINGRADKAVEILKRIERNHKGAKILITGSFLFFEEYNDIDIFIISKYDKEDYRKGKLHFNYLKEGIEKTLFFNSITKSCISNFNLDYVINKEMVELDKLVSIYQELVIYILGKKDFKSELRNFLLYSTYYAKGTVTDSKQINESLKRITSKKKIIQIINKIMVQTLVEAFESKELNKLKMQIILNQEAKRETKIHDNLDIYNKTYKEVLEIGS